MAEVNEENQPMDRMANNDQPEGENVDHHENDPNPPMMNEAQDNNNMNENNNIDNENDLGENDPEEVDFFFHERENWVPPPNTTLFYLHMAPSVVMIIIIWYSMRIHEQLYPTVLHLTSSKFAFCVFGMSVGCLCLQFFRWVSILFLGDLRLAEREAIAEGMRWGLTETCLALTMFREEINVKMAVMFVTLVGAKGWHWAIEMRGKHIGNTQEALYLKANSSIPRTHWNHVKFLVFAVFLYFADIWAVYHCALQVATHGPSVHILFGFEAAVLSVTAASTLGNYYLHAWDGFLNILLQIQSARKERMQNSQNNESGDETNDESGDKTEQITAIERYSHFWKDKRGTYSLTLDLLSQASKFSCYLLFFAIIFTYYGMPINIFRELYVNYQQLRRKITAFASYWRLSRDLETKFETVHFKTDKEQPNENGDNSSENDHSHHDDEEAVCIICRDHMVTGKKLPGCGHIFHAYCLKDWLMQQQTCPTCRSDITAAAARVKVMEQNNNNAVNDGANDNAANTERPEENAKAPVGENMDGLEQLKTTQGGQNNPTASCSSPGCDSKCQSPSITKMIFSEARFNSPSTPPIKNSNPNNSSAFPCLYRIQSTTGAPVYAFSSTSTSLNTPTEQNVVRTVPRNKMILCTEMKYLNNEMMLQMPDGWVREQDVKRMVPIPFDIPRMTNEENGEVEKISCK